MINRVQPLVAAKNVTVTYPANSQKIFAKKSFITAVKNVTVEVRVGQSLAIVGESGSGKSSLVKAMLGLENVASGEVTFAGRPVLAKGRERWLRAETGMIFQDPYSSLDPRMNIGASVAEPLEALNIAGDHEAMVRKMLDSLELPSDSYERYPAAFSGGQRQRIAIARALVHSPRMLIGDEPVSALDVLVRRKIIKLLADLRTQMGLTMITVTHDLGIVPDIAERVLVLKSGQAVEEGPVKRIFTQPEHPYTRQLITALPRLPKL